MTTGRSLVVATVVVNCCYCYHLYSNIQCLTSLPFVIRYLHGCNVLYELVKPWANTNSIVVADSYFASFQAALRLKKIGLRFIGVMKSVTKEYPMAYLGRVELH